MKMERTKYLKKGQITKALSGFYYITTEEGKTFQTRARGVFRKKKITPLVGDFVHFESEHSKEGTLTELLPRKNQLIRPPVANIDKGIVVSSAVDPAFSTQLLDRFLVMLEYEQIEPIIFVTKMDLANEQEKEAIYNYQKDYQSIGYSFIVSDERQQGTRESLEVKLKEIFKGNLIVFMGQSGAGKSTLLNQLKPELQLKTAETSQSLGRGKHTTRHVELLPLLDGLVADTPGFSSLNFEEIEKEELTQCFPEMWEKRAECKFKGCMHDQEPKCAVKNAVENGEIRSYRYDHYLLFLKEIQERKPDYSKKNR